VPLLALASASSFPVPHRAAAPAGGSTARRRPPAVVPGLPATRGTTLAAVAAGNASDGLAARFRDGEPDAVRDLYHRYGRSVFGVAYRALGDRSLAEEAVQQTFLQAWRAAPTVDASRDIGPWLFTISRRVAIDLYRKESRRRHDDVDDVPEGTTAVPSDTPAVDGMSERWEIRSAVDGLPDDEREIVRLQHFAGLTHVEIAAKLDVPVGTVKSRSFRAHKRLAAQLAHLQEVG
jgi:RNA polymerase sigma-70 factor (ECF subfamily)